MHFVFTYLYADCQCFLCFYANAEVSKWFQKTLEFTKGSWRHLFFYTVLFFKNSNFLYVFLTKYSLFLMVLRENKILSQVWHTTLNLFYTLSKQTPLMNSWVYFKRKPSVCTRLVLTSSIFKCLITYPLCLYSCFLENH